MDMAWVNDAHVGHRTVGFARRETVGLTEVVPFLVEGEWEAKGWTGNRS